jgi:tricorn protease
MLRFTRSSLVVLVLAVLSGPAAAQEPIRFARTPDVSPDGKMIAFSYLGDIYTVETIGGTARAVTSHPAHDINPVFSPDGRWIAFSSNRHGNYDVFVVPSRGGRPRRLTFDSAPDMVCDWTPDGKHVLFASTRSVAFPPSYELYTVPFEGGRVQRVSAFEGKQGVFSPRGDLLAYVRGPGSWYRKGYRGSSNDDVWVCKSDGTENRRITSFNGQDSSPMWSADGQTLFYVSEHFGTSNIVRQPLAPSVSPLPGKAPEPPKPVAVTQHTDDAVRLARISRTGEWIVYECGPDLWVVSTAEGSKPRKLAIEVNADDKSNPERVVSVTRGVTEFALSHDEQYVIFAVHGKLFRAKVGPNPKPTQITFGPSNDHSVAWAPNSSKILFVSDRGGHDDVYVLEPDDPDHPKFVEAHKFKEPRQITSTREAEMGITFSPDGRRVAFIRGGKLWTMRPTGTDQKVIVDDVQVFDYDWSPDGKWFVFARRDGSFASELYIVPSEGATTKDPIRNVTRYATSNGGVTWSANGKKLAFLGERRGVPYQLHVLDLEKPEPDTDPTKKKPESTTSSWGWGSKPPLNIDFDDIHLRARPVVRGLVEEAAISPDGSKVAFRDLIGKDLWVASTDGSSVTRLTTGGVNPRQIQWSRKSVLGRTIDLVYFLDGTGNIRLASASTSSAITSVAAKDRMAAMSFKIKMSVRDDETFHEMFDQSWRYLSENFYDDKFHGSNWDEVRKRYRPLVKHVSMKEDLYALLYLMMGELNASHLGVIGFGSGPEELTAELGLVFDESYRGKGLKIAEILKRGPADRKTPDRKGALLNPGETIIAIDGTELDEKTNIARLLNGKVDELVELLVTDNPTNPKAKRRRVELKAISRHKKRTDSPTAISSAEELMYDRWVARNAATVAKLSGVKLGYIHIPSMDEDGLDAFVRALYSDNYDKEAIVLDVRYNGGGYTHDQVLNYLGSREHTIFKNRDGGQGLVLRSWDRKWHKPLTLLINNRSYSDAEIFPNAFRTLELGKLVGEPTGGMVIGTAAVRLVDGSLFRIPRIGVYTTKGVNMDKEGVRPDVYVETHPDQLARGQDAQLERAVSVLQEDVVAWKKKRTPSVVVRPVPVVPVKSGGPVTVPPPPRMP